MLLPLFEPNDSDNGLQHVLKRLLRTVSRTANDHLIEFGEDFVFFEDHGSCPAAVVDGKVKYPFVGCGPADIAKKFVEILLSFEVVLVVDRHLCEAHDFLAFL